MIISLILLFFICLSLSFVEEQLKDSEKRILYIVLGFVMILIAGLREVGSTPDSASYEEMFYAKEGDLMVLLREPSFTFIVDMLHSLALGVNALFFVYAILSIPLHLTFFWKVSKLPFLTLTIYLSYYYMMHDLVQIRCAVASGLFLWAIYLYVEKKKVYALVCILLGILFHYSAAAGLVIFMFSNRLPQWQRWVLYAIVPVGLVAYFTHFDVSMLIPDELGGLKLMKYRNMRDKGIEDDQQGWRLEINILIWMNFVLYYASIYYHDYLVKHMKHVTIAIKLQAVGFLFLFFAYSISKVLGNRMNDYFSVVSILLWTASYYAFRPQILSKILNNAISTVRFITSMLGYALSLLWL